MAGSFDFGAFLEELSSSPHYAGQIVHQEVLPAREAVYGELSAPLPAALREALAKLGIEQLYSHQASAIEHIRGGEHTVIVTSTASGKTLCYHLPVLETLLAEPGARCLALFPTKALAQDQLRALRRLADVHPDLATLCRAGTYDGDTPTSTRRKLRGEANFILTNPEMLHQGILPSHSRWASFFSDLRYVIIDEVHTYRGIFGSNVANVLQRLQRICAHYGSSPTFVCCSATIANPKELAEQLTGLPVALVDNDGAPKGPKRFLLWNPPHLDEARMERRSSNLEAQELLVSLLRRGVQTIAFARTRVVTELLYRYASQSLAQENPSLAEAVRAYRAGYLPEERREIERRLFSGELMGVTSTNALELGIDVGSLDAAVIVSYPGTIASTWQQAGRAGRGAAEALVVLVAYNDPLDQYLMQRPEFVFGRSPEHAVIDPHNPYLLANHLQCAAYELPLREDELAAFGPESEPILDILQELRKVQQLDRAWYWSSTEYPAAQVNLRAISDATFTIMDSADGNRVIGTVDAVSAPEAVYPGGVYLHEADTYLVRRLDLEERAAYVERADVDYYTQAVLSSNIVPGEVHAAREAAGGRLHFGEATVSWQTTAFTRFRFYTQENVGYTKLDLPAQHLETASCWFLPSAEALALPGRYGLKAVEGLSGIRNVAVNMLPLVAMCDRTDVGGLVNSSNFGTPAMFLYDRYPGGLGFSEKGYQLFETLLAHCLDTIAACPCEDGCPSCVGLPVTQPAQQADLDLGHGYAVPDKEAALVLLHFLLGREPYVPRRSGRPRRRPRTAAAPQVDAPHQASVAAQVSKRLTGRRGRIGL